jgi:hypothetical protein
MKIIIVTAEPNGTYHLKNLEKEIKKTKHDFIHLIPYPEKISKKTYIKTTSNIEDLYKSDRVVIIGDIFTTWTELVAQRAINLGKEIIISQIPYGHSFTNRYLPRANGYTATSKVGALLMAKYHSIDLNDIIITGHPENNKKIKHNFKSNKVLILTTKTTENEKYQYTIVKDLVNKLTDKGYDITIRTHPREEDCLYLNLINNKVMLSKDKSLFDEAKDHKFAVGIPGSAHMTLISLGLPVIAYDPKDKINNLPYEYLKIIKNNIKNLNNYDFDNLAIPSDEEIIETIGYNKDSVKKFVGYWTQKYITKNDVN